jgi:hypothetical protein
MLPFAIAGGGTTLYMLWALMAYPIQISVKGDSIVYINQATNNTALALLYVIATCGSLFFSRVKTMVLFGAANLLSLLLVMAVKGYAFTSLWCAYAALASSLSNSLREARMFHDRSYKKIAIDNRYRLVPMSDHPAKPKETGGVPTVRSWRMPADD